MKLIKGSLVIAFALLGSACASLGNVTTVYRKPDLGDGRSVILDAEQWGVLNIPHFQRNERGELEVVDYTTCSMPSPDTMSVVGAGADITINNPTHTEGGVSIDIGESGSNIGLRTQSIQLLRDGMYRACEAYAIGGIDPAEFGVMMRRYQANMIAILAIEQLTNTITPRQSQTIQSPSRERQPPTDEGGQQENENPPASPSAAPARDSRTTLLQEANFITIEQENGEEETQGDEEAPPESPGRSSSGRLTDRVASAVERIAVESMGSDYALQMCFELLRLRPVSADQRVTPDQPSWLERNYCPRLLETHLGRYMAAESSSAGAPTRAPPQATMPLR